MEIIRKQTDNLSPVLLLVNQVYKDFLRDFLHKDLDRISYFKDSFSTPSYEIYRKDIESIHDDVKRMQDTLNIPKRDVESISKTLEQMRLPTPLELLSEVTISENLFDEIDQELSHTDWNNIRDESSSSQLELDYKTIDFVTKEPERFASELYQHIEELDDEELNSVFTKEFLSEITQSWWILPDCHLKNIKNYFNQALIMLI